jgi:hypothetical protein
MSIQLFQPTSNTTPDPGQGGLAVSGAINTGHGSTLATGPLNNSQTKTCLWTGFSSVTGHIASVKLKFDWTESGTVGDGASNSFTVQYSINGGGAWLAALVHNDIIGANSGSSEVTVSQTDLTQVRVRDKLEAVGSDIGSASVTASISNISLEVTIVDGGVIVLM